MLLIIYILVLLSRKHCNSGGGPVRSASSAQHTARFPVLRTSGLGVRNAALPATSLTQASSTMSGRKIMLSQGGYRRCHDLVFKKLAEVLEGRQQGDKELPPAEDHNHISIVTESGGRRNIRKRETSGAEVTRGNLKEATRDLTKEAERGRPTRPDNSYRQWQERGPVSAQAPGDVPGLKTRNIGGFTHLTTKSTSPSRHSLVHTVVTEIRSYLRVQYPSHAIRSVP